MIRKIWSVACQDSNVRSIGDAAIRELNVPGFNVNLQPPAPWCTLFAGASSSDQQEAAQVQHILARFTEGLVRIADLGGTNKPLLLVSTTAPPPQPVLSEEHFETFLKCSEPFKRLCNEIQSIQKAMGF